MFVRPLRRLLHTSMNVQKAHVTGTSALKNPKWVQTGLIHYVDPTGKERDWEFASRSTRVEGADCDGVGILAVLEKRGDPEIVLEKQFRAPIGGVCIEMPAGLLDPNESIETCAERELFEETGYIGKAQAVGPLIYNDPGFCNTNLKMVTVKIDLSDERNQNPKAHLEENEFIEVFSIPIKSLYRDLARLSEEGFKIDARVQNVADGVELAKKWII